MEVPTRVKISDTGTSLKQCDLCPYTTKSSSGFRHHSLDHGPKKLECDLCDYKTTRKSYLKVHIRGVHLNKKPHKCDKCDYATGFKSDQTKHMKQHHVTCDICSVVTTQILRHMKIVHNDLVHKELILKWNSNVRDVTMFYPLKADWNTIWKGHISSVKFV